LQDPYFATEDEADGARLLLRAEVAKAVAHADAERQRRHEALAAFEQELAALSS